MPYITANIKPRYHQISFTDILNGCNEDIFIPKRNTNDTRTWYVNRVNEDLIRKTDFRSMYEALVEFNTKYADLISVKNKRSLYYSFKIPKRSGGLRQIDAPHEPLKLALRDLKRILETKFYASYHSSAFAYIKGRSTLDAVKRHQSNDSRWYFKADATKFFPSTTKEFLLKMLYMTYPICEYVCHDFGYREELEKALSLCFLDGGLPQGTPTSPMLTNMMMIPIDHALRKMASEHKPRLVYTRYADDMLFSSEYTFHWTDVQNKVVDILASFDAPFVLNPEKSRYGSRNGRNWNLGVMVNQDNKITVGWEKKKVFRSMLFQFMSDYERGVKWSVEDVQHLLGIASYYRMVEGQTIDDIVGRYSTRFNKDVLQTAKDLLYPKKSA